MLINGAGAFQFTIFQDMNDLIDNLHNYVHNRQFNLYTPDFIEQEAPLGLQNESAATELDENVSDMYLMTNEGKYIGSHATMTTNSDLDSQLDLMVKYFLLNYENLNKNKCLILF